MEVEVRPSVIDLALVALSLSSQGWLRVGTRHVFGPLPSVVGTGTGPCLTRLALRCFCPRGAWRVARDKLQGLSPPKEMAKRDGPYICYN